MLMDPKSVRRSESGEEGWFLPFGDKYEPTFSHRNYFGVEMEIQVLNEEEASFLTVKQENKNLIFCFFTLTGSQEKQQLRRNLSSTSSKISAG